MSFLNKTRALILGTVNDLVDKTIDLNSPTVIRQYVRDLEGAIDTVRSNTAIQDGQYRTMVREQSELTTKIANDKAIMTKLLTSTDPTAAGIAHSKATITVQDQQWLNSMTESIAAQQKVSEQMKQTVTQLETKHEEMLARVRELERMDRDTKAKESAANAITQAGKIAGNIDNPSVDDVQDRMHRRNDVASAQFDAAMGSMHTDQPDSEDVNDLLDSLKPKTETVAK